MKSLTLLAFGFVGVLSFAQTKPLLKLQLTNTIPLERKNQSVEIASASVTGLKNKTFIVKNQADQSEIPYQWLSDGKLLIQADFKPNEHKKIIFTEGTPSKIDAKVYGRFVPERYDDFAWENDKIAFRMYGKSLEKVPNQNAWGMDAWSKRTNRLILDEWYKLNNYHNDNGDGLDFFHVGSSLGAGDVLPFVGDKLTYLGNYQGYKIIDKGPLRFSFQLEYPEMKIDGYNKIAAVKKVSLDTGSQMNKVEVTYTFNGQSTVPVFAGLVHWDGKGEKTIDDAKHIAAYWPEDSKDGIVGTAMIFPGSKGKILNVLKHLGEKFILKNNQPLTFYSGAAWSKAGVIQNNNEWKKYLEQFAYKSGNPVKVTNMK
ncbi:DUF4861 family protein [Elizabethkingia meningoseptica]|uniref:DUF4861 family protein n=1 Tax=Elizabethkingia meningoseptica TaxID=238 RepID=UPI00301654AE